jgi:hypothetical protein
VVSAFLAAAALIGAAPSACPATTVRYERAKHPTLWNTPWVLGRPTTAAVAGFLISYQGSLRDGRVNRSDGLVLWTSGARIFWTVGGTMRATRIDGRGSFGVKLTRTSAGFRSEPRFPSSGCWRLTVRNASIVARVVVQPTTFICEPTRLSGTGKAFVRPRSSGIYGGWTWQTAENGALMYTHGVGPGDLNAKVPWFVRRNWGSSLELVGTRLDAAGSFRQEFPMAFSPRGVFPSIVDVPAAGCWLFRLRTGRLAGVLVVRAIDR